MGYTEYLKNLLRPLQVYALEEGYGAAELEVLGETLDRLEAADRELEREASPATALEWGLESWEALLPYRPAAETAKKRQAALKALMAIKRDGFTPESLRAAAGGCGLEVELQESGDKKAILISFPKVRGIPENMAALQKRIEAILPCHLELIYVYSYFTWLDLEKSFANWGELEAACADWKRLEIYMEEDAE